MGPKERKKNLSVFNILLNILLGLLGSELGQALADIVPGFIALNKRFDSLQNLLLTSADLFGAVTVTQCECVVIERLEVDSDTERCAKLVVAGITLANTGTRIIHTVGDTQLAQLGRQVLGVRLKFGLAGEGNKQDLGGSNSRGERKDL